MFFNLVLFFSLLFNGLYIERQQDIILVDVQENINLSRCIVLIKFKDDNFILKKAGFRIKNDGIAVFKIKKEEIKYFDEPIVKIRIQKDEFRRELNFDKKGFCL